MDTRLKLPNNLWQIDFTVPSEPGVICQLVNGSRVVLEAGCLNGQLSLSVLYDQKESPLQLRAPAQAGAVIRAVDRHYRIELYVNDRLADEEWPYGNHLLNNALFTVDNSGDTFSIKALPEAESVSLPEDPDCFEQAQDWLPGNGVFVGDCMPFCHNGTFHLFYLQDRHHHQSKWGKGAHQWAHISSTDLVHWQIHPLAITIDDQAEGSICTGSVICLDGRFYAFYAVRMMDGSSAPLKCAVSDNGIDFSKTAWELHLSGPYRQESVRDPKVFRDGDGRFHLFVTTSIRANGHWQGCLAHLFSSDLVHWQEMPQPALRTECYSDDYDKPWTIEPECSDYFFSNGWYYLISRSRYVLSRKPFGPWQEPANPVIPCGAVPKMAFWKDNRIIFAGFQGIDGYAGRLVFAEALSDTDGTLRFVPVREMSSPAGQKIPTAATP